MITLNIDACTAVSNSATVPISVRNTTRKRLSQIDITGTAKVIIEGRMSPAAAWAALYSATMSEVTMLDLLPEMRARATDVAEGTQAAVYIDA